MSMHSLEALFDPVTDAAVRHQWQLLLDGGLRSLAAHQGETNAPHLTLSVAPRIPDSVDAAVRSALRDAELLPLAVGLGPLVVLGARRPVLARLVVPTAALLTLHAAVASTMADLPGVPTTAAVGRWVPHVTLARIAHPAELGQALEVLRDDLGSAEVLGGHVESVRRWDPDERRVTEVAG